MDIWPRDRINAGDIKQSEKVVNSTPVVKLMAKRAGRQTHLQSRGQTNNTACALHFQMAIRAQAKSNTRQLHKNKGVSGPTNLLCFITLLAVASLWHLGFKNKLLWFSAWIYDFTLSLITERCQCPWGERLLWHVLNIWFVLLVLIIKWVSCTFSNQTSFILVIL